MAGDGEDDRPGRLDDIRQGAAVVGKSDLEAVAGAHRRPGQNRAGIEMGVAGAERDQSSKASATMFMVMAICSRVTFSAASGSRARKARRISR